MSEATNDVLAMRLTTGRAAVILRLRPRSLPDAEPVTVAVVATAHGYAGRYLGEPSICPMIYWPRRLWEEVRQ